MFDTYLTQSANNDCLLSKSDCTSVFRFSAPLLQKCLHVTSFTWPTYLNKCTALLSHRHFTLEIICQNNYDDNMHGKRSY